MVSGAGSGCINHPGVEATVRCKMCTTPVCDACVVNGPTGAFCSQECQAKHEHFVKRAHEHDAKVSSGFFGLVRRGIAFLIVAGGVCFALGVVGTLFEIPILTDLVYRARDMLGF